MFMNDMTPAVRRSQFTAVRIGTGSLPTIYFRDLNQSKIGKKSVVFREGECSAGIFALRQKSVRDIVAARSWRPGWRSVFWWCRLICRTLPVSGRGSSKLTKRYHWGGGRTFTVMVVPNPSLPIACPRRTPPSGAGAHTVQLTSTINSKQLNKPDQT